MRRLLLFDGSCKRCSRLASVTEVLGEGRVEPVALQSAEARDELGKLGLADRWEPMLLTIDGSRTRAHRGLGLRLALIRCLGVRRGIQLSRLARREFRRKAQATGATRRRFLRGGFAAAAGVLLGPEAGSALAEPTPTRGQTTVSLGSPTLAARMSEEADVGVATSTYGAPQWHELTVGGAPAEVVFLPFERSTSRSVTLVMPAPDAPQFPSFVHIQTLGADGAHVEIATPEGDVVVRDGEPVGRPSLPPSQRGGAAFVSFAVCVGSLFLDCFTRACNCASCPCFACTGGTGIPSEIACAFCAICVEQCLFDAIRACRG